MMLKQILIGSTLILLTSLVHLFAAKSAINLIKKSQSHTPRFQMIWNLIWLDAVVMLMIVASVFEAMIWAIYYSTVGAIESFEEALYFSIVTFTTLGYGDITADPGWRILASLEAATGIIIFGWSTAIVMSAIQHIYFSKSDL